MDKEVSKENEAVEKMAEMELYIIKPEEIKEANPYRDVLPGGSRRSAWDRCADFVLSHAVKVDIDKEYLRYKEYERQLTWNPDEHKSFSEFLQSKLEPEEKKKLS